MDKIGKVLVIGGGIGGMEASLNLVEAGFKVYLADEMPNIGGKMAQLDKTFPTNDCSMCIMAPKLVEVGRNPNIDLLMNTRCVGPRRRTRQLYRYVEAETAEDSSPRSAPPAVSARPTVHSR